MNNILPCPMCGSPCKIDSTAAAECYGHDWQSLYIECTDVTGKHCDMNLDLQCDFHNIRNASEALIECWNRIASK